MQGITTLFDEEISALASANEELSERDVPIAQRLSHQLQAEIIPLTRTSVENRLAVGTELEFLCALFKRLTESRVENNMKLLHASGDEDGLSYTYSITGTPSSSMDGSGIEDESKGQQAAVELLQMLLRSFRNLCVECPTNQSRFGKYGIIMQVIDLLKSELGSVADKATCTSPSRALIHLATQFLGNAITGHTENQKLLWPNLVPDLVMNILDEMPKDKRLAGIIAMVIHNCLCAADAEIVKARCLYLSQSELVLRTLLQRCVKVSTQLEATFNAGSAASEQDANFAMEWITLMFEKLLSHGHFSTTWIALSRTIGDRWEHFAPEHLVFMHMLEYLTDADHDRTLPATTAFADVLLHNIESVLQHTHSSVENQENARDMSNMLDGEILLSSIRALGNSSVVATEALPTLTSERTARALVDVLAKKGVNVPAPSRIQGLVPATLRAIANLTHQSPEMRDTFRHIEAIPMILSHCRLDVSDPLMREWGVVAIRNLCEDNTANQELITSLQPQSVVQTEELRRLGIKAELRGSKVHITPAGPDHATNS